MALNKKQTSLMTKIVLGVLVVVFVTSFISIGSDIWSGRNTSDAQTSTTGALDTIAAKYAGTVQAYEQQLASDPTSYTVLVNQANTYFDWGIEVRQAAPNTGADTPMWVSARSYYERAMALSSEDPAVATDYSIAVFYSGDTAGAIAVVEPVMESSPEFAPAFFNAGIFYNAAGDAAKAAAAMQRYLELDPNGQVGDPQLANDIISQAGGAPGTEVPGSGESTATTTAP